MEKHDAGWILFGLFLGLVAFVTTGCSFKVEMGYHGQTGRDDRVQTQLVRGSGGVAARKDERY